MIVDFCPDISEGGVFHRLDKPHKFLVHQFQFRTDAKDDLYTFLFGHLRVGEADLPDVIDNIDTVQYNLPVYLVPVGGESHSHGIAGVCAQLLGEAAEIVGHTVYFMVEAVNLCGHADNGMKGVQIIVELALQGSGSLHLLTNPDVAGGLEQHDGLLFLQFLLCLVGIGQNHACQHRVFALRQQSGVRNAQKDDETG